MQILITLPVAMETQIHYSLLLHSCRPITLAADANSLFLLQTPLFVGALGKMFGKCEFNTGGSYSTPDTHDFQ